MISHVALLRGINVGKGHRIAMKDLADEFASLGFTAVKTHINSGNVWFEADFEDEAVRARRIEAALRTRFGFEIPTLLRTLDEMRVAVAANPYGAESEREGFYRNVAFLESPSTDGAWQTVESLTHERERIARVGREVYSLIEREPGEGGKFAIDLLAKTLKAPVTVRNWNTTRRLADGPS